MKNKAFSVLMLVTLLLSTMTIVFHTETALATSTYGPSLIVDDTINRINATLGIKSGSLVTAKGVITNIGTTALSDLLTGVYFIEGTGTCQLSDFSFEFSLDCVTWFPIDPSEVKLPSSAAYPMHVELVIGQAGGETLDPSDSLSMYLRINLTNDLTPISRISNIIQSMIVWVFGDTNLNRHFDPGELIYSQPPSYAGYKDWDDPIKIDLEIVHTAEIDGTGKFYYNIQDAIDAANSGDTVLVYDGTYREALYIDKSLTLKAGSDPIIEAPDTIPLRSFTGPSGTQKTRPIILVYGAVDVTVEGFTVDGRGVGNANYGFMGIQYFEASGTIKDNTVKAIRSTPLDGMQHGVGIVVNHLWDQYYAHSVVIDHNIIFDYQKGGIVCNEPGTTATVTYNTVTGFGPTDLIAQNGIQFGWNATGTIDHNEASGHVYTLYPDWSSAGILLYQYCNGTLIHYNDVHDNQIGIDVFQSSDVVVSYNDIYDNTEYGVNNAPSPVVNARYNWWGDQTGPYHPALNPEGLGDNISDDVNFIPWLQEIHDVAVLDVSALPSTVVAGENVTINVTVANHGSDFETFTVRVYYDSTEIANKPVIALRPNGNTTVTFEWTTSRPSGEYRIKAKADAVPGETHTSDNEREDGNVTIIWHDVAVVEVIPNRAWVYQGHSATANVTVVNQGDFNETVTVRLSYNGTNLIENALQTININVGESKLLVFTWATNDSVEYCQNYTLTAIATIIPLDNDLADNSLESTEMLKVRVLGDTNGDDYVGVDDIFAEAVHFGAKPGHPKWDPDFDLNLPEPDGYIGIDDIFIIATHFGQGIPPEE